MIFAKDQWYEYDGVFYQYSHIENAATIKNFKYLCFRKAGNATAEPTIGDNFAHQNDFIPATIDPDFSNAKEGDSCFCAWIGNTVVNCINYSSISVQDVGCDYCINGRCGMGDTHPTLFNSFAQFKAYWAEWELEQK